MNEVKMRLLQNLSKMRSDHALRMQYEKIAADNQAPIRRNEMFVEKFFGVMNPGVPLIVCPEQFPPELVRTVTEAQKQLRGNEENLVHAGMECVRFKGVYHLVCEREDHFV